MANKKSKKAKEPRTLGNEKFQVEQVSVAQLKPHPRNYRAHPEDQLAHLIRSLEQNGFYRNIVVAKDGTILAGHGVVEAAKKMKVERVPVIRLEIDPNDLQAIKVLTGDNESGRLAEVDDRVMTDLLKELKKADELLGTGFDEKMLAALVMVTRPASELRNINEAAEWVGMPGYTAGTEQIRLVVTFLNEKDRAEFVKKFSLQVDKKVGLTWSTRWPFTEREDVAAIRIQTAEKKPTKGKK